MARQTFKRMMIVAYLRLVALSMLYAQVASAQDSATPVIAASAELAEVVEEIPLSGTVMSTRVAKLSTEISGLIEVIQVEIGDRVSRGDEILRLDVQLEALALKAKKAETEQARQQLADARRRLQDAKALGRNQTVSANEIKSLAAEVQIDSTVVTRLQAEERQQALRVEKFRLKAPFSGVISQKLVEQGEWVVPGQAVVELVDTEHLVIEFQAPQAVYARLDQLGKLTVRLDALPQRPLKAKIEAIVPVTDRASRTFLIRASLVNEGIELIPGLSASAVMTLKTASRGVVIHRNALLRHPDGRITVWVVNESDGQYTVTEKRVQTGLSFNGSISITEGLEANALVVIEGNETLREGQAVSLRNPIQ